MSVLGKKVKMSLERLKAFQPRNGEGYYLAFSGGKDSVVCKRLLDMAGLKYDAHYRVTSVDPPELVQFIKNTYCDVHRDVPHYPRDYTNDNLAGKPITMWNLIPEKKMPPTRLVRYCCQWLKESGGDGRKTVTGVRWAESAARKNSHGGVTVYNISDITKNGNFATTKKGGVVLVNDNEESRRIIENCYKRNKVTVNPIVEWTDKDVWEFIKTENIPYCGLYDCGFSRLGCIGCPMATKRGRETEFRMWPKYKESYLRAFDKMLQVRKQAGKPTTWKNAQDCFNWWMQYDIIPGQMSILGIGDET